MRTESEITKGWPKDNDTPLVTVVAISYCHEKYLHTALDGILAQETNFPFEVIVHDDASPDNSASIIRKYAESYPHIIKPILEDENQFSKGAQAIFLALKASIRGKYIAFLDCDDYWTDVHKLQKEADYLEAHPAFLAVAHNCTVVDADGMATGEQYPECRDEEFTPEHFFNNILAGQFSTLMIRDFLTKALDDHLLFINAPPGPFDRVLSLTLLLNGRIHCIQESMSAYRHITSGGTSFSATFSYDIRRDARFYLSFVDYCKTMGRIGDAIGMLRWFIDYTERYKDEGFSSQQEKESILAFCRRSMDSLAERLIQRPEAFAQLAVYVQQPESTYYTEKNSVYENVLIDKRYRCSVPLSEFGEITNVRIDPMQRPCVLHHISVHLFNTSGEKIDASILRTNAITFRDDLIFGDDDPQIELCIPQGSYESLYFSSELISCDPDEISYLRSAAEIENQLLHSESERKDLTNQLEAARHDYNVISNSTFWKITKPARIILDTLKRILYL